MKTKKWIAYFKLWCIEWVVNDVLGMALEYTLCNDMDDWFPQQEIKQILYFFWRHFNSLWVSYLEYLSSQIISVEYLRFGDPLITNALLLFVWLKNYHTKFPDMFESVKVELYHMLLQIWSLVALQRSTGFHTKFIRAGSLTLASITSSLHRLIVPRII